MDKDEILTYLRDDYMFFENEKWEMATLVSRDMAKEIADFIEQQDRQIKKLKNCFNCGNNCGMKFDFSCKDWELKDGGSGDN